MKRAVPSISRNGNSGASSRVFSMPKTWANSSTKSSSGWLARWWLPVASGRPGWLSLEWRSWLNSCGRLARQGLLHPSLPRCCLKLREQDVDYSAYGPGTDYEPPFLYRKSRFINEEDLRYPDQLAFEAALEDLDLFDFSSYGPPPTELFGTLARHRWEIAGFALRRARTTPALDDPCGRFLRFRDLIHCGETQAATGLENLPEQVDSWNALLALTEQVLDPVIDWFGMIRLTYGFCSPALAKDIRARGGGPIDPKRDQHAAHERNRLGNPICPRLGAAVDFLVEDEDMLEVARWVAAKTPFDRLYFYGPDRPIHVSHGPAHSRQVVAMRAGPSGRLVPRQIKLEVFLRNSASDTV